jgi:DNA mismatch repair protein MutL
MPASLKRGDAAPLVRDLALALREDDRASAPLEKRLDHVLATMACRHSVRAGCRLGGDEVKRCCARWNARPAAANAIYGRPTYVELKLADVEKLFGRR